jgi:HEPN domain-containing protein
MPLDPARIAEARPWFVKADHDLRAAGVLLAATPPLLGEAAYHCQQAAEKSLKGYLSWHDHPFGRTHDLAAIGGLCVANDATLEAVCQRADRLSVFAWAFRYPGDPEEPTRTEVEGALALAREAYEAMLAKLPPELRP